MRITNTKFEQPYISVNARVQPSQNPTDNDKPAFTVHPSYRPLRITPRPAQLGTHRRHATDIMPATLRKAQDFRALDPMPVRYPTDRPSADPMATRLLADPCRAGDPQSGPPRLPCAPARTPEALARAHQPTTDEGRVLEGHDHETEEAQLR